MLRIGNVLVTKAVLVLLGLPAECLFGAAAEAAGDMLAAAKAAGAVVPLFPLALIPAIADVVIPCNEYGEWGAHTWSPVWGTRAEAIGCRMALIASLEAGVIPEAKAFGITRNGFTRMVAPSGERLCSCGNGPLGACGAEYEGFCG